MGCSATFPPGYSPDFNPIQKTLSRIKSLLGATAAHNRGALHTAVAGALLSVT